MFRIEAVTGKYRRHLPTEGYAFDFEINSLPNTAVPKTIENGVQVVHLSLQYEIFVNICKFEFSFSQIRVATH